MRSQAENFRVSPLKRIIFNDLKKWYYNTVLLFVCSSLRIDDQKEVLTEIPPPFLARQQLQARQMMSTMRAAVTNGERP
jgi:hypothetical protein